MKVSMALLPPSPVSACVPVDVRLGTDFPGAVRFRLSTGDGDTGVRFFPVVHGPVWHTALETLDFRGRPGRYELTAQALDAAGNVLGEAVRTLEVLDSPVRSTGLIDGAWCGLYHWSEQEGRLWNAELREFTDDDWRELVRGMHSLGMDIVILQELFRNQQYYGKHDIEHDGYHGRAFYPSALFPDRVDIAAPDPVEAILDEADKFGMAVLPGIGMYAWFDFTAGSLEWHKQVAREVFQRYGHHRSFYGWYISEEVFGNLHYGTDSAEEIVHFFHEMRLWLDRFDPTMPVMLAPNCFDIPLARAHWERLAAELDIICPFGFHRMSEEDIGPDRAIRLLQQIADDNGAHLWLDMEAFLFTEDTALYPRPIGELVAELNEFATFEKILCYQYPGLFNAPDARRRPGGDDTVRLFLDYQRYYRERLPRLCASYR